MHAIHQLVHHMLMSTTYHADVEMAVCSISLLCYEEINFTPKFLNKERNEEQTWIWMALASMPKFHASLSPLATHTLSGVHR